MMNHRGVPGAVLTTLAGAILGVLCNEGLAAGAPANPALMRWQSSAPATATAAGQLAGGTAQSPRYASGQVIVKFKQGLQEAADVLFATGARFQAALPDASDSVDRLNATYRVQGVRPLFATPPGLGSGALRQRRQAFAATQQRLLVTH